MNPHGRQTMRAWLGAGLILLLIALAALVFMLDPILARLRPTYSVVVVLPEAPQLGPGSRVWVSGRDVGKVTTVAFLPAGTGSTSNIVMDLELPTHVQPLVRRDSDVRVTSARMVGDPVIDIIPGSTAAPALAAGDTLRVSPRPTAAQLMARARTVQFSLDTAVIEARALRAPLAQRLAAFEQVQQRLALVQREAALITADLERSPALAELRGEAMQTSLDQARNTLAELARSFDAFQQRAERSGLTASATALRERSLQLRQTLAALEQDMQARGGTLDRLQRDSALFRALEGARAQLDSLIVDAKRNPLRYVF